MIIKILQSKFRLLYSNGSINETPFLNTLVTISGTNLVIINSIDPNNNNISVPYNTIEYIETLDNNRLTFTNIDGYASQLNAYCIQDTDAYKFHISDYKLIDADYTLLETDHFIGIDVTNNPVTITLSNNLPNNKIFIFKHLAGNISTNNLVFDTVSSVLINGAATVTYTTTFSNLMLTYINNSTEQFFTTFADGAGASGGGGNVDPGTIVDSTLRWDGSDWVENAFVTTSADGELNMNAASFGRSAIIETDLDNSSAYSKIDIKTEEATEFALIRAIAGTGLATFVLQANTGSDAYTVQNDSVAKVLQMSAFSIGGANLTLDCSGNATTRLYCQDGISTEQYLLLNQADKTIHLKTTNSTEFAELYLDPTGTVSYLSQTIPTSMSLIELHTLDDYIAIQNSNGTFTTTAIVSSAVLNPGISLSGGINFKYRDGGTGNVNILLDDYIVVCSPGAPGNSINLPVSTNLTAGRTFRLRNRLSGDSIDLIPNGADTIDGNPSITIATDSAIDIIWTGTDWTIFS